MSADILSATLELRRFLFASVYENEVATAEFGKARKSSGACGRKCGSDRPSFWTCESSRPRDWTWRPRTSSRA